MAEFKVSKGSQDQSVEFATSAKSAALRLLMSSCWEPGMPFQAPGRGSTPDSPYGAAGQGGTPTDVRLCVQACPQSSTTA